MALACEPKLNPCSLACAGTSGAHAVTQRSQAASPTRLRPPRFVGREAEIVQAVEALGAPPTVVLVEGEAGIGKTRLVREVLASPVTRGHKVPAGLSASKAALSLI